MLRLLFVYAIVFIGVAASLKGPFFILLFYLWNAHFRPEFWVWAPEYIVPLHLSLIVGTVLVFATIPRLARLHFTSRTALLGLFFAQSVLSLAYSEYPAWSWVWWFEFAKVVIITTLIPVLVDDLPKYRLTLLVICYSIGLEAAKQGWAQLVLNPGGQNNNPHPVLGDNNGVGMAMMMLIPFFIAFAHTAKSRLERGVHRFFLAGLFYRGISTYSRGAFLAAGVLGAFTFARSKRKFRAVVGSALVAGLALSVMPDRFWDRMSTITASDEERDASAAGRLHFWEVAKVMADARPLTGVGFNAYRQAYLKYDPSGGAWGENRAVHSAWFGVLAEMGYPGLALFVAILVGNVFVASRIRRGAKALDGPDGVELGLYAAALQTSLIIFAVGVTFLNGQYNELYWHLIGLSMALEGIERSVRADVTQRTALDHPSDVPPMPAWEAS